MLHSYTLAMNDQKIKETIPVITATKRIKYQGINLHKETKDLYWEDNKIPVKEIKDDTNRWRDIPCSCNGKINIIMKMMITTQSNKQIQCNPNQITNGILHKVKTNKQNLTIHMDTQKTPNSQSNLEKGKCNWRNQASWLQIILQTYSHQDSRVLAKKKKTEIQNNGTEWWKAQW